MTNSQAGALALRAPHKAHNMAKFLGAPAALSISTLGLVVVLNAQIVDLAKHAKEEHPRQKGDPHVHHNHGSGRRGDVFGQPSRQDARLQETRCRVS